MANRKQPSVGSIRCKAAVVWAPGEKFSIEYVNVAPPRRDQVRIRILYTAICRTDVTFLTMKGLPQMFPIIAGHESSGIVESVGEGVTNVQRGDYVMPFMQAQCGQCPTCKSGRSNVCKLRPAKMISSTILGDDKPHFTTEDGKIINRLAGLSTFSEYTVVHKDNVAKINPEAPMDKACLLSCGVATGMGAVWKDAKVEPGSTTAVFGLGTVGLAVVQACKSSGASRIIGVDINENNINQAKDFGMTEFINHKDLKESIPKVIQELVEGGVDYSFECVGDLKLISDAIESTQKAGGVAVIIGVPSSISASIEVNIHSLLLGRKICGTLMGGVSVCDLPELVEQCTNQEFQLDPFISHTLPFLQINEAMEIFCSGSCLRCILDLNS